MRKWIKVSRGDPMREISVRRVYCSKRDKVVTVVEQLRCNLGHEVIRCLVSCSEQEGCATLGPDGEVVFSWGGCPVCEEMRGPMQGEIP